MLRPSESQAEVVSAERRVLQTHGLKEGGSRTTGRFASKPLLYSTWQSHLNIFIRTLKGRNTFKVLCTLPLSPAVPSGASTIQFLKTNPTLGFQGRNHSDWFFNSLRYRVKECFNTSRRKGTQVKSLYFFPLHFCATHLFPGVHDLCPAVGTGTSGGRTQLPNFLGWGRSICFVAAFILGFEHT